MPVVLSWRRVALHPAHEARFVLPHIPRGGEDTSILRPDDLAVDKCADFIPSCFGHGLSTTRVPAIPCGIRRNGFVDGDSNEVVIEIGVGFTVVPRDAIGI